MQMQGSRINIMINKKSKTSSRHTVDSIAVRLLEFYEEMFQQESSEMYI